MNGVIGANHGFGLLAQPDDLTILLSAPGAGDGPSGAIQAPMTAAGFAALTGRTPTHAYTCQEASGSLLDQIGSLTLPAAGGPTYQTTVPGWTRKGVTLSGVSGQGFFVAAGSGPNPTSVPVAMLLYFTVRTGIGSNQLIAIADNGGVTSCVCMEGTGVLQTFCGANTNNGVIDHRDTLVHAVLLTFDIAASSVNRYSDLERDDGAFGAGVLDGTKGIGGCVSQRSYNGEALAYWILEGAAAQFTAAQAKSLLQSLGWTIPWS